MSEAINLHNVLFTHRCEENGYVKNFKVSDFEGLHFARHDFKNKGYNLFGGFYFYDNHKEDDIVIFCHGLGCGLRAYMTEIATIAKKGYVVYSYDCIGCSDSEGDSLIGITGFLSNLHACIKSLRSDEKYKNKRISVVGHSFGGYAASNILNYVDDIHAIVAISEFLSIESIVNIFYAGDNDKYIDDILEYEKQENPDYYDSNAINALSHAKCKVLIIHDDGDTISPYRESTKLLKEKVDNPMVKYITTKGKNHNPNFKVEAVEYMNAVLGKFNEELSKNNLSSFEDKCEYFKDVDWKYMTQQDNDIYKEIFETLD